MTGRAIDVAAAVDAALPLIRAHADEIRKHRRLTPEVDTALRATGIDRMALPASLGGLETPTADALDVLERIAAADGSTGWCAMIGAGSNIFAGYLPEEGAHEVFADPDRSSATMFAPAPLGTLTDTDSGSDGALHLDGRWPFVSNCLHAEWIGLGALRCRDRELDPVPQLAFARADELTIEDSWDVVGLRGTGSHHVSANDIAVDRSHFSAFAGPAWPDGPLWRMPVLSVILPMLVAVPLGIARGALDEVGRQVHERRVGAWRSDLASDPVAVADYAAASLRLDAARALLLDLVRDAREQVSHGDALDRRQLARIYLANLHASDIAVEVTDVAHRLGGGAAAYANSPLLHALNDIQAVRQHYRLAHEHRTAFGRILGGLNETYPPYIT